MSLSKRRTKSDSCDCKRGEIYRIGYLKNQNENEIYVPGKCICATSQSKLKRSEITLKTHQNIKIGDKSK